MSFAALSLATAAIAATQLERSRQELSVERSLSGAAYTGSQACRRCHPSHYASFARTYHRTMTREASASSVLGSFDGRSLDYLGVSASMERRPNDEYWMTFRAGTATPPVSVRVERSVGSHRYQQYLARDGDIYFRLPIAWDIARGQFFHMNGAFLTADPVVGDHASVATVDYNRHVTRWNDNCVYCHNVHPRPGLDPQTGHFETEVAELGVACEACHGPGAEHIADNASPLRRYALHGTKAQDPSIRNPARMPALRSAEVCGRCHGQRMATDIDHFHQQGDSYIPGEALARYSTPLSRDTRQNGQAGLFRSRFWPDGSPRLTAYEFQGYLQSGCRASASFTCESCHAMHAGEPAGQLRPDREDDAACTQCHTQLNSPTLAAAHMRHPTTTPQLTCRSCHMPDIVYGLVSVHLSHRIESPDVAAQAEATRPDACTLCHVDRTRAWASRAQGRSLRVEDPADRMGLSETGYQLLAGDPIQRAVAVHALGNPRASASAGFAALRLGLLVEAARNDPYPAIRSIARSSLEGLLEHSATARETLAAFVATARYDERDRTLRALCAALPAGAVTAPDAELVSELRARASELAIEIGE